MRNGVTFASGEKILKNIKVKKKIKRDNSANKANKYPVTDILQSTHEKQTKDAANNTNPAKYYY